MKNAYTHLSFAVFLTVFLQSLAWSAPAPIKLTPKNTKIEFFAVGKPSFLKIRGESKELSSDMTWNSVQDKGVAQQSILGKLTVKLDSFSTGLSLRDKHMKNKSFEIEKFPDAVITLNEIKFTDAKSKQLPFDGNLKFHGTEKPIQGTVDLEPKDSDIGYSAQFKVKMTDYGIARPEFSGMTIDDEVEVKVNGKLSK